VQETAVALEPLHIAKILKEVVGKEEPELVILGKQAIDGDYNQTGRPRLARLDTLSVSLSLSLS